MMINVKQQANRRIRAAYISTSSAELLISAEMPSAVYFQYVLELF